MFRRVVNTFIETAFPTHTEVTLYPNPFSKPDTVQFGWLSGIAPCFPLHSSRIKILSEPAQFYDAIKAGCDQARDRIVLVSLYFGTGDFESSLVSGILGNAHFQAGRLKVNVLLDFMRGSRFAHNSRTMLQPLLQQKHGANCDISLYHTPALRGLLKRVTPNRWNELVGLQHMKLYIFDDKLVISGANLSKDYFTNRQDRYFVIEDKKLCDFYSGLVERVERFSLKMNKDNKVVPNKGWNLTPYKGNKYDFVHKAGYLIENYILETRNELNSSKAEGCDTWIFPLVQMGQLGVDQDAQATDRILAEAPPSSTLCVATGYFNLTSQYMSTLIRHSQANCNILMAHPEANGFLGASGPAGGIPFAYSLIAKQFQQEAEKWYQGNRIQLFEYLRKNWTYHGKGLWYYPPFSETPCATLIGSPNFGERSVNRDLETQLALVTENPELRLRLNDECKRLYKYGLPAETKREVPGWVHGFVYFFRNYF